MDTPFSKTLAMAGSLEGPETPISTDSTVRPSSSLTVLPSVHRSAGRILSVPWAPQCVHPNPSCPQHLLQVKNHALNQVALQIPPYRECMLDAFVHLMRVSTLACGLSLS